MFTKMEPCLYTVLTGMMGEEENEEKEMDEGDKRRKRGIGGWRNRIEKRRVKTWSKRA